MTYSVTDSLKARDASASKNIHMLNNVCTFSQFQIVFHIMKYLFCINHHQSLPISINQNQSKSLRINQNQLASSSIYQHQLASIRIQQNQSTSINIIQDRTNYLQSVSTGVVESKSLKVGKSLKIGKIGTHFLLDFFRLLLIY